MRQQFWDDQNSKKVENEKNFFQAILAETEVFNPATLEDAKYLFFSLPSIIIVKGYACGFTDESIKDQIKQFIDSNKAALILRKELKISFK